MSPERRPTHTVQRDVEEFHRALGCPIGETPAIRRPELRAALIEEEAAETVEAIERGDLVAAIDGMCDLLCVVYGTAIEFGVDLAPFWDEVHRTNMAKQGGPVRRDGKRLKPPGWQPPRIRELLHAELRRLVAACVCDPCEDGPYGHDDDCPAAGFTQDEWNAARQLGLSSQPSPTEEGGE